MVELLSPVGDFDCLKAAVQNGANAVYFAAKSFGARAFASNFDDTELQNAINYAKLRGVKTHLTLNTLIKENEFESAFSLAKKAYEYGIDAIIVQDLGLAKSLIKAFPDLDIHASTQMTVHNLEGVQLLKDLGFKRAVLSRELSFDEIKYICQNSDLEIEVFVHGALCISYSGQCLFSSMIGGRSGNRGKCAQTCRLPYELLEEHTQNGKLKPYPNSNSSKNDTLADLKSLDKGYLLSTKDLCSLEFLPKLIQAGITSFKIEGRMKSPEYVATVTRIYRKYIDMATAKNTDYVIDENDKIDLMQVFNRGGFSLGHLSSKENRNLVYKEKQNNMGIYLGTIVKYNKNKGHVTCKLNHTVSLGDSVSFENENTKYTISELMQKNNNIKDAAPKQEVTFGRMKGNIKTGDKIFKIVDKKLSNLAIESISSENIKIPLECNLKIKSNQQIYIKLICKKFKISIEHTFDYIAQTAKNMGLTEEKVSAQFSKTQNTVFNFDKFDIELDENLFMPISTLNEIRRTSLELMEREILGSFKRKSSDRIPENCVAIKPNVKNPKISLLLNILNLNYDYSSLENVDRIYIPLKYFANDKYFNILADLNKKFNLYIYMPTIIRKSYIETAKNIIAKATNKMNIKGIVISNLSQLKLIENKNLSLIGNYTLNTYNTHSADEQSHLGINTTTISPELDEEGILGITKNSSIPSELIVYGNTPVMTLNYCILGKSNKCYKECTKKCMLTNTKFYLKDRLGINFRLIPDNTQTITTIYNSKITSIEYKNLNPDFVRIDILDEDISKINEAITTVKQGHRFEGKEYTNGNLNRTI